MPARNESFDYVVGFYLTKHFWFRQEITGFEDYADEAKWFDAYSPVGRPENAQIIYDYAKDRLDYVIKHMEDLEKKADDMTKVVTAVFAALAVLIARVLPFPLPSLLCSITGGVGFILFCACLYFLARTRVPIKIETPMTTRDLMVVSDNKGFNSVTLQVTLPDAGAIKTAAAASMHGRRSWPSLGLHCLYRISPLLQAA